jgi:Flp pilus assembly protein TadD
VAINPNYADAHNNLGLALGSMGDVSGAVSHLRRALEIRPGFVDAANNLTVFLRSTDVH